MLLWNECDTGPRANPRKGDEKSKSAQNHDDVGQTNRQAPKRLRWRIRRSNHFTYGLGTRVSYVHDIVRIDNGVRRFTTHSWADKKPVRIEIDEYASKSTPSSRHFAKLIAMIEHVT